jgi:hypothetical protein
VEEWGGEGWPIQGGHRREGVDDLRAGWPDDGGGDIRGPGLDVFRCIGQDEVGIRGGEAIPVEDEGVQELALRGGEEEPGPEPPGGIDEVGRSEAVVEELEGAGAGVNCDGEAELGGGVDG